MWSQFQSIASNSLTSSFATAFQNALAFEPEVIKSSLFALIFSSTESISHFKAYY